MRLFARVSSAAAVAAMAFCFSAGSLRASGLGASYFSMDLTDLDVGNNQGQGSISTVVGGGLGPDGLPIVSNQGVLHDVNGAGELTWWSPAFNSHISVLNNPVYPTSITLPFDDENMYTNSTVLGANGDDNSAFLTAEFQGTFTVDTSANLSFSGICSDDDEFIFLSGGVFGGGTLVVDNGGIHGKSCNPGNVNTGLLQNVAAGNYTLSIFYADRQHTGAVFAANSTLDITPVTGTPEPATWALIGAGLSGLSLFRRRKA